ncbi:MAG TPA: leucyl aminopeptidase [Thermoplasmata archaeon]|nr:leucyl aminopeptidase [Thermoplasmata archaeon]
MSQVSPRTSSRSRPPESASTDRRSDHRSSAPEPVRVRLDPGDGFAAPPEVIALGLPERGEGDEPFPKALAAADAATGGVLRAAWTRREFRGKRRELTVFHRPADGGRVVLIGLGPSPSYGAETVRRAAAEVVKGLRGKGARTVGFVLASFARGRVDAPTAVRALADGAMLGGYEFVQYKSSPEPGVEATTVFVGRAVSPTLEGALAEQRTIAEAVLWAREVANLPADTATPARLADEAQRLGKELSLKVTVFDERQLAEMGCGGLLAVGGGSAHPPRMIVLEHPGKPVRGAPPKTVALVGKGITFDSGGISIKPAAQMSYMKFDKSGAVAVLGTVRAAALLGVPSRVVGVLCCAENLPSGGAYRPGDLVRTFNGKTIEVLNTDAEGRVVLADGLGYVSRTYQPDVIVDIATLTGAEVVALGDDTAGLITGDEPLARALLSASAKTGEPLWRMPLTDYHRELVKSEVGDVRNSIEIPLAGMLTAGAFLEAFVDGSRWAHLDIAGPAYTTITTRKYQPAYQNAGATAFGVRLLTRYLLDRPAGR